MNKYNKIKIVKNMKYMPPGGQVQLVYQANIEKSTNRYNIKPNIQIVQTLFSGITSGFTSIFKLTLICNLKSPADLLLKYYF